MQLAQAAAALGLGTGAIGLGTGIVVIAGRAIRLARRIGQFVDDWHGRPARPGVPRSAGVMERIGGMEERLGAVDDRLIRVEHELTPNSGLSMKDQVNRIEHATTRPQPSAGGARHRAPESAYI